MHTRSCQAAYEAVFGAERLATLGRARAVVGRCIREGLETVLVAEDRGGGVIAFASVGPDRDGACRGELYAIYALRRRGEPAPDMP